MNILCVLGEHAYGDLARGEGYEFVNFLPAFRRLGHTVSVFESFSRKPDTNFALLNRALLKQVEETSPDVVFCVLMQYEVWTETMRLIRKSGAWLVNWSTDDSWKYAMFSRLIGCEFDLYLTTCANAVTWYQRDGIGSVFLSQWGANAETLVPPLPANECCYPVSFIGAAYGNRPAMVDRLRREGMEVVCFGHGWPAGAVETKRVSEIIRESQISLNFSEGARQGLGGTGGRQIKARVFEVPGYGGCLLTEAVPDVDRYFQVGEEVCVFEGADEMVSIVKLLLAHPERRERVARLGFERVGHEHTYDHRFKDMLRELTQRVMQRPRRAVDWMEFESAARRHRVGPLLSILRSLLVICAKMIWGGERGPRAARRFVFELSWRLFGAHTYAAAGWPGRMFYKES